jgi:hypothetical protein
LGWPGQQLQVPARERGLLQASHEGWRERARARARQQPQAPVLPQVGDGWARLHAGWQRVRLRVLGPVRAAGRVRVQRAAVALGDREQA